MRPLRFPIFTFLLAHVPSIGSWGLSDSQWYPLNVGLDKNGILYFHLIKLIIWNCSFSKNRFLDESYFRKQLFYFLQFLIVEVLLQSSWYCIVFVLELVPCDELREQGSSYSWPGWTKPEERWPACSHHKTQVRRRSRRSYDEVSQL